MINSMDPTQHYKMYKKGKHWLIAGLVTVGLGVGVADQQASADTTPETTGSDLSATVAVPETAGETTLRAKAQDDEMTEPEKINDEPEPETPQLSETNETPESPKTPEAPEKPVAVEPVENTKAPEKKVQAPSAPTNVVTPRSSTPQQAYRAAAVPVIKDTVEESINDWMPNQTLQIATLRALQSDINITGEKTWTSVNDITKADLALLKSLSVAGTNEADYKDTYIDGKTEFSLKGLEFAVNLEKLRLVSNLNASSHYQGDIVHIEAIAGLTKLKDLDLSGNRIQDITSLKGLTNLTTLNLTLNSIWDFSVLKGHTFQRLDLKNQFIELPVVRVNSRTRTGYLPGPYINENGEAVRMVSAKTWKAGIQFTPDQNSWYRLYTRGSASYSRNDDESLFFKDLHDQEPADTGANLLPQDYKYSMIGVVKDGDYAASSSRLMVMVQPYIFADEAAPVVASYQDTTGKVLAPDVTLEPGLVGDSYVTTPLSFEGYTLTKTPENATGVYGTESINVVYVYEKNPTPPVITPPVVTPVQDVTITVHYQTADGRKIAEDTVISGQPGTAYQTQAIDVAGYELVTTPENADGVFGESNAEITYVYMSLGGDGNLVDLGTDNPDVVNPDEENQTDSAASKTPDTELGSAADQGGQAVAITAPAKGAQAVVTEKTAVAQATLPQTDEKKTSPLIGLAVLGATVGLAVLGLRRKKF